MEANFVAHYFEPDKKEQSVRKHLEDTASFASMFTAKIGLPSLGRLEGLLHDFGKYSQDFQTYIKSAEGKLDPDMEPVDVNELKGKIDHSTAGAQMVWETTKNTDPISNLVKQIIALCVASHHSGLIDCLSPDGEDKFSDRIAKNKEKTHFYEVTNIADKEILDQITDLLHSSKCSEELKIQLELLYRDESTHEIRELYLALLVRFIFSALIDADRLNSAGRGNLANPQWNVLIERLEKHLAGFKQNSWVNEIRSKVAHSCKEFAAREKGLYQLTVPTGGAKTLSSLRFGLHHASHHKMERLIFVIPYTSIIDQNAAVARSILEINEQEKNKIVLEHHSNLTQEKDTRQNSLLAENWDAPVVFTTMVQFLEVLYSGGTRGVRRMHRLANAVIIFDEVQTVPIKTIHLFNNAVNFLVKECGSTVVFCTATQPLLNMVDPIKGSAKLSVDPEMAPDVNQLFKELHRVDVVDRRKIGGLTESEIAQIICDEARNSGSALAIVNTKSSARELYQLCKKQINDVFHLSTNMCPAHRKKIIDYIKKRLEDPNPETSGPLVCISTQLIEAGVDIDFGSVIRYLAGLDSIAQAAGRCNRNGKRPLGKVTIVNLCQESLDKLPEIKVGKEITERILNEYYENPDIFDRDLLSPKVMKRYYEYYFFNRAQDMSYRVSAKYIGHDDNLLNLLSINSLSVEAYKRANKSSPLIYLRQSFKSAANSFEVINAPTEGIIAPYGEDGRNIIADLCAISDHDLEKKYQLLRKAQQYSINVYPQDMKELLDMNCVYETQEGSKILCLDEGHYDDNLGVVFDKNDSLRFLNA